MYPPFDRVDRMRELSWETLDFAAILNIVIFCANMMGILQALGCVRTAFFTPLRKIPGPFYARFTGVRLIYHSILGGDRIHYVHGLHQKYGPVVRISPTEIDVASPEAAREVHRMGTAFTKAPFYDLLSPGPVHNIFNFRVPAQHTARRKLYAKAFTLQNLRKEWEPVMQDKIATAVRQIKKEAAEGSAEIMKWWTLMANDIVCRLTFGGEFNMVESGKKDDPFVVMLDKRKGDLAHLLKIFVPPLFYLGRFAALLAPRSQLHDIFFSQEKMFAAGGKAVENARAEKRAGEGWRNLFARALAEEESEPGKQASLTDVDIITDAGALLLAGSDPAAISLTWLIWCVLRRPQLQAELEQEVASIEGPVTDEACERLPLMNAVIDESMRLYGAAPGGLPRSAPKGGAVLGGYFIPQDTVVTTQNWTIHRDPSVWRNPDEWDHTRWLSGKDPEGVKMAFSPFGQGSRQCLGIHMGKMEMRLATATFFRECRGAKLALSTTSESMIVVDSFVAGFPKSRKCEIVLP